VFEVLPFDNRIAVLKLTGSELQRIIDWLTKRSGVIPLT
jgi:2',3'-cyclic-nucleotide 2'-phosphodiesterase (5'-nucleotidase family)